LNTCSAMQESYSDILGPNEDTRCTCKMLYNADRSQYPELTDDIMRLTFSNQNLSIDWPIDGENDSLHQKNHLHRRSAGQMEHSESSPGRFLSVQNDPYSQSLVKGGHTEENFDLEEYEESPTLLWRRFSGRPSCRQNEEELLDLLSERKSPNGENSSTSSFEIKNLQTGSLKQSLNPPTRHLIKSKSSYSFKAYQNAKEFEKAFQNLKRLTRSTVVNEVGIRTSKPKFINSSSRYTCKMKKENSTCSVHSFRSNHSTRRQRVIESGRNHLKRSTSADSILHSLDCRGSELSSNRYDEKDSNDYRGSEYSVPPERLQAVFERETLL